jgi:hypothetical protein
MVRRMSITKLGDAQADFDAWLEVRKGYLSSSEMYTWLGDTFDWWGDTAEDILDAKRGGPGKVFDEETETTIAHGVYDETNVQEKFGYAVGCDVRSDNGFYVNDKFPGIGASIDGWGCPWDQSAGCFLEDEAAMVPAVHAELSQDRNLLPRLRETIDSRGTEFLTEIKKSLSVKWRMRVPEYYVPQVKTQLSVLEVDYAIIVAETVHTGKQKWRKYWDLRAYVIERDPEWDEVLKREGEKFLTLLEE